MRQPKGLRKGDKFLYKGDTVTFVALDEADSQHQFLDSNSIYQWLFFEDLEPSPEQFYGEELEKKIKDIECYISLEDHGAALNEICDALRYIGRRQ